MDRLSIVALINAAIDRLNNRPLGLGGLRRIGTDATSAAPGTLAANDFLVKTSSSTLSAERVVTDTTTITWDWATPGQAKATAVAAALSPLTTKGDVAGYSNVNARIPVGSNGQVLTADSTAALGVAWAANAAVPTSRTLSTTAPLTGGGDLSANRTLAISAFTGDSGAGGAKGAVPAPAAGDAAAGKVLGAGGGWVAGGSGITQLTGDVTAGPGSGSQAATLANTAVGAGSYGSATASPTYTVDAKGRLTAAANVTITPAFSSVTGKPTTLGGYGITDALAASLLTTKGDLLTYTTTPARLAVGADGRLMQADSTQTAGLGYRLTPAMQLLYGGGADGALVLDGAASITVDGLSIAPVAGVYTLTADMDATTCTMSGTATLRPMGYFARGHKLIGETTNTIHDNGNSAVGSVLGSGLTAAGTTWRNSQAGQTGRATLGAGSNGSGSTSSYGGKGGNGGAGGAQSGGTSSANTIPPTSTGRQTAGLPLLWRYGASSAGDGATIEYRGGGAGSSGGNAAGVGTAGGSGGGGGVLALYFAVWDFAGVVSAVGGAGGAAATGVNGGGGGGGGGDILRCYEVQLRAPSSVTVAGGTGGAGSAGGGAGVDGVAGRITTVTGVA